MLRQVYQSIAAPNAPPSHHGNDYFLTANGECVLQTTHRELCRVAGRVFSSKSPDCHPFTDDLIDPGSALQPVYEPCLLHSFILSVSVWLPRLPEGGNRVGFGFCCI